MDKPRPTVRCVADRPSLRSTWWGALRGCLAAVVFALGCCPKPVATVAPAPPPGPKVVPAVLDPSLWLELVRLEREAMEGDLPVLARREAERAEFVVAQGSLAVPSVADSSDTRLEENAAVEPAAAEDVAEADEPADGGDPSDDGPESDVDEVRKVVVRVPRFATPEVLARALLRSAESRRPRELYEARLLLRHAGPVRACGADDPSQVRQRARSLVRSKRNALKRCIIDARGRLPDILAPAPAALVVEQAQLLGDAMIYRFVVTHTANDDAGTVRVLDRTRKLDAEGLACIRQAVAPAMANLGASVQVPLIAFGQRSFGHGTSRGRNAALARQAAVLGWLHYDRGELEDAVRYFRDAYWVFQLAEYRLMEGRAWDAMGWGRRAAAAYAAYLDRRPHGLEAEPTRLRLRELRAAGG